MGNERRTAELMRTGSGRSEQAVAVVGMACRFPGARDTLEYFSNLRAGHNAIRQVPRSRWDVSRYRDSGSWVSPFCGVVDDVDTFDHRYFAISPREAARMDPQQRLLLEEVVQCMRDAGVPQRRLQARRTGVYVGFMAVDQQVAGSAEPEHVDSFSGTGSYACLLANRVSYAFGLSGPSLAIDAACAASLVALHEAKEALLRGECEYALVAGVSLNLHPWKYLTWSKSRMLSPTGQCRTFDQDADGYVPGDGIGVVLLQRSEDACRTGSTVRAVIRGSAIGHGGQGVSLTAPRVAAQQDVITRALADGAVDARTISYVEAHGTGTSLGDPIEVEALTRAFRAHTHDTQFAMIGSVKSNIGHLEGAAGVAGLIKVVLMLQHERLVPTLHVRTPNPMICFEQTPFRLALREAPWRAEHRPLRAGLSSFGIGGVNSHVIVEQAAPTVTRAEARAHELFVLSARTEQEFEKTRASWLRHLEALDGAAFADMCRTQTACVVHERQRAAVVVRDRDELRRALQELRSVDGEQKTGDVLELPCWHLPGFAAIRGLYATQPHFRRELDRLLCALDGVEHVDDEHPLFAAAWSDDQRALFSDAVSIAFWRACSALGYAPRAVRGEGAALSVACALAGVLEPEAVLNFVHRGLVPSSALKTPSCDLYDPVSGRWAQPLQVDAESLVELTRQPEVGDDEREACISRAQALATSQRTYQKFLAEWDPALAAEGYTAVALLGDAAVHAPGARRALAYVVAESTLRKLHDKWSLGPRAAASDARMEELLGLLARGELSYAVAVRLLLAADAERPALAAELSAQLQIAGIPRRRHRADLPAEDFRALPWLREGLTHPQPATCSTWSTQLPQDDLRRAFDLTLCELWLRGAALRWDELEAEGAYRRLALPLHTFEPTRHPLPVATAPAGATRGIIADHVIAGERVLPGALVLEAAQRAAAAHGRALRSLILHTRASAERGEQPLTVELDEDTLHVRYGVQRVARADLVARTSTAWPKNGALVGCDQSWEADAIYRALAGGRYEYGETLRVVRRLRASGALLEAELSVPQTVADAALLPHLVDGALQVTLAHRLLVGSLEPGHMPLPAGFHAVHVAEHLPRQLWVCVAPSSQLRASEGWSVDIEAVDEQGAAVFALSGVSYREASPSQRADSVESIGSRPDPRHAEYLVRVPVWVEAPAQPRVNERCSLIVDSGDPERIGRLREHARARAIALSVVGADGDWAQLAEGARRRGEHAVYVLDAVTNGEDPRHTSSLVERAFALLQGRARARNGSAGSALRHVLFLTRAAFVVGASDRAEGFAACALAGVAHAVGKELPDIAVQVVDIEALDASGLDALLDACAWAPNESIVAQRGQQRFVRRLETLSAFGNTDNPFAPGKHYLVVGGSGGIGQALIAQLADVTDCKLTVLSRRAPTAERSAATERRLTLAADITDRASLGAALARAVATFGPLHGVLQLAGVTRDRLLAQKEFGEVREVLAPKVQGTSLLDELTRGEPLDFFICFSSIVALQGNIGQIDYAAANAFLDGFMAHRRATGAPGASLAINWPLWRGVGMAERMSQAASHLRPISGALGVDALCAAYALRARHGQVAIEGLPAPAPRAVASKPTSADGAVLAASGEGKVQVERLLRRALAKQLELPSAEFDPEESLFELGLDSLIIQDLTRELELSFGELPPTLFFEQSSLRKLVDFFAERAAVSAPATSEAEHREARDDADRAPASEQGYAIAVVGMDGRFARAEDVSQFWDNLVRGEDCVVEIPAERWDHRQHYGERDRIGPYSYGRWGSFIDGVDSFDPSFFQISPKDAEEMDPQQRLFLQCAWKAMEDAGYVSEERLARRRVGVFVGTMWNEYTSLASAQLASGAYGGPGSINWAIANRVSYFMNLTGPSLVVDTACSSSLTALHLACQAILHGDCEMAIAGGVNLSLERHKYVYLSQAKFLSSDGKCRSFGEGGDGYVPGEGVASVVLKPLAQALRDRDQVYAVIRGSAINHGGRATAFTVPNPEQQASVIASALERARISPRELSYVECHGTGTALGDPIEVRGLTLALARASEAPLPRVALPVGSLKSNIGHLEAAAGIAATIKVIAAMQHGLIPKTLHAEQENPKLQLQSTPLRVVRENEPWSLDGAHRRVAAVSSFGAGGANAHLVLERVERAHERAQGSGPWLFPLSAKTQPALLRQARALRDFLSSEPAATLRLDDVAYTLQVGRRAFRERFVAVAGTRAELISALDALARGQAVPLTGTDELTQRALRFLHGEAPSVFELERSGDARIVSLPTYAFERERFWLERPQGNALQRSAQPRDALVRDHRVAGRPTLPGAYFLVLARELCAARDATLCDVTYLRPCVVNDALDLQIRREQACAGEGLVMRAAGEPEPIARCRLTQRGDALPRWPGLGADGESRTSDALYTALERSGLQYGETYRVLQHMRIARSSESGLLQAEAELREDVAGASATEHTETAQIDALLQACLCAAAGADQTSGSLYLPYAIGEARFLAPLRGARRAHVRVRSSSPRGIVCDALLCDAHDQPVLALREVVLARSAAARATLHVRPTSLDIPRVQESPALFAKTWSPVSPPRVASAVPAIELVVFERGSAHTKGLEAQLQRSAPGSRLWSVDDLLPDLAGATAGRDPRDVTHLSAFLRALAGRGRPVWIMHLLAGSSSAPAQTLEAQLEQGPHAVLRLLTAMLRAGLRKPRLLVGYAGDPVREPGFAALAGMLRSAVLEYGGLACATVGARPPAAEQRAAAYWRVLCEASAGCHERVEADGLTLAPRWRELASNEAAEPLAWTPGSYLITGGLGGLGLVFAERLLREPGVRVVLTGRAAADPRRLARLVEVAGPAAVLYAQGDVCERADVARWVELARAQPGGLRGVLHAAGVRRDGYLAQKSHQQLGEVIAPKVLGTLHLDAETKADELSVFALFSSITAAVGNAGQVDYAYANAFMDAFAARRAQLVARGARTGRSVSLNWPFWEAGGMSVDARQLEALAKTMGIRPMSSADGLRAFDEALRSGTEQVTVAVGDLTQVRRRLEVELPTPRPQEHDVNSQSRRGTTMEYPESALRREIIALMSKQLKLRSTEIDERADWRDFGFDSVSFAQFASALAARFQVELSPAVFFQYADVRSLGEHLRELGASATHAEPAPASAVEAPTGARERALRLDEEVELALPVEPEVASAPDGPTRIQEQPASTPSTRAEASDHSLEPIAIIGLTCAVAGARDPDELWRLLLERRELAGPLPRARQEGWAVYAERQPELFAQARDARAACMEGVDQFDAGFFNISPREADLMDPQQRLFLQAVWSTVEDAGYRMRDLWGRPVGLFVGVSTADYHELLRMEGIAVDGVTATGLFHSIVANRVSYLFNFTGPSEPIDTACSSSLVAVDRAVRALRAGQCEVALAGGVNLLLAPTLFAAFREAGMLSPEGRCRTFDTSASGYVRGEGVGAVMLKPLSRAVADGDHIYAVVRGSAVQHAGRANSLTAPNARSQADVLVRAYREAGIDPSRVGYIEAHGTATKLGDPVEVEALKLAFRELSQAAEARPVQCVLGSIKSNVGHLESAAGIAGLAKVLLSLQHGKIPANANFERLNEHIQLAASGFEVAAAERTFPDEGAPRVAGVSSFGFGGINAHVVVEQFKQARALDAELGQPVVFVLSASSEEQLRRYALRMADYVEQRGRSESLLDIAYTTQVGRTPLAHRLALVVAEHAALAAGLRAYAEGRAAEHAGLYTSTSPVEDSKVLALLLEGPEGAVYGRMLLEGGNLAKLSRLWTAGVELDWASLPSPRALRRVSLPTYPFRAESHWYTRHRQARPSAARAPAAPALKLSDAKRPAAAAPQAEVTPADPLREVVASCLCETLKIERSNLDPTARFAELGLDSIMSLRFVKQLGASLGRAVDPRSVVDAPTLDELVRVLARQAPAGEPAAPTSEGGAGVLQERGAAAPATVELRPEPARVQNVRAVVVEVLADVLFSEPEALDPDRSFSELGLDSVLGLEFVKKLSGRLQVELNASAIYQHASIARLTRHLSPAHKPSANGHGVGSSRSGLLFAVNSTPEAE